MKKFFSVFICIFISIYALGLTSFAIDNVDSEIELFYSNASYVSTNISISGKTITYSCRVQSSKCTKISIYLYLQEYKNGSWTNIDVVSKTINSSTGNVSDTYSSAVSGHKYRTEAHIYAYVGSNCEYIEDFSSSKTCP